MTPEKGKQPYEQKCEKIVFKKYDYGTIDVLPSKNSAFTAKLPKAFKIPVLRKELLSEKFQKEFEDLMSVDDISFGSMPWLDNEIDGQDLP